MALSALQAGLTLDDLRHAKYTHVVQLMWEWEDMHDDEGRDETVEAKPSDVKMLMTL